MRAGKHPGILATRPVFFTLSALFIVGCALLGFAIIPKGNEIVWMASNRTPFWNQFFLWITRLGEAPLFLIAIVISLFIKFRQSLAFVFTGLASMAITQIAKGIFRLPRPKAWFTALDRLEEMGQIPGYDFHTAFNSFPSGHTLGAFSFFTLLTLLYKHRVVQLFAFFLAALTGISRIYLGQHFLADLSLGALLGILAAIMVYYLCYRNKTSSDGLDRSL